MKCYSYLTVHGIACSLIRSMRANGVRMEETMWGNVTLIEDWVSGNHNSILRELQTLKFLDNSLNISSVCLITDTVTYVPHPPPPPPRCQPPLIPPSPVTSYLCLGVMLICSWANPFTLFHPSLFLSWSRALASNSKETPNKVVRLRTQIWHFWSMNIIQ